MQYCKHNTTEFLKYAKDGWYLVGDPIGYKTTMDTLVVRDFDGKSIAKGESWYDPIN